MVFVLAVDFGGTKVEAALVDEHGVVLEGSRSRQPTGARSRSDQLAEAVRAVASDALGGLPTGDRLIGVGIGSAGPIVVESGRVSPLNVPAWRDYPLRAQLEALVPGLPVRLAMDGLCITLAEHWIGAGRGIDNLMGMIVSTGIGGGLILGGHTVPGPTGNAGHIGHVGVGGFDDRCACGGVGCVEAIASGPKTVAWAQKHGWRGSTGEDLAADYARGEKIAVQAVARAGRALGQAIGSATSLTDLELVAIGGGFARVSPDLFQIINDTIAERAEFGFVTKVRVVPSGLSDEGPLIGAAALVHRGEVAGF
ncbi:MULTISPECIES: ROK family protein [unclassified Diaminobutyricimonas]|uniref:ROK family protein n=1 Tax=unclassified Diaminobutyricimonas TaxID=2643261 RepID=UPI0012F47DBD|nr:MULTISPECIES: ROK family protein [unclassified Diaminobutyricimonas]